jgi:hypothetical protein
MERVMSTESEDFKTDMDTINSYVQAVQEAKTRIVTAYLSAIDNFQTTVSAASPSEAKVDLLGAALKSGLKAAEKAGVAAVKSSTGADLGPIDDFIHAIADEIDRAAKASASVAVADWIKKARARIANSYTQDQTGESLKAQIINEYNQNDEGGRGGYIADIENKLSAMQSVEAPIVEIPEVAMYAGWINSNFNNDCMDGTGVISIQFDADGNFSSASVIAPQGDKIAGALNTQIAAAGIYRLMDLDVVKRICRDDQCMCFEGNNTVRKDTESAETHDFLSSSGTWDLAKQFSV